MLFSDWMMDVHSHRESPHQAKYNRLHIGSWQLQMGDIQRMFVVIFLCGLLSWQQCYTYTVDPSVCRQATKCGECQGASPECSWCSYMSTAGDRCERHDLQGRGSCHDVVNQQSLFIITQEDPISNQIQLSPQRMSITLYKGRPVTFPIRVNVPQSRRGYRRLTLRIRMQTTNNVEYEVTSPCPGFVTSLNGWNCPRVQSGEIVQFTVKLTLRQCGDKGRTKIRFKASGVPGAVRVYGTSSCTCGCEYYSIWASNDEDERCSYNGNLLCGICECYPGYNGDQCECRRGDSDAQCTLSGQTHVCSGHGECVCGHCQCARHSNSSIRRYTGQYCECDNNSCDVYRYREMICGGSQRGKCQCGQCVCREGFEGDACETSTATSSCVSSDGLLCHGHGMCVGGSCHCEGYYRGPTCEDCPTCPGTCSLLKNCVMCRVFNNGPLARAAEQCAEQCSRYDIRTVDAIDETNGDRRCRFRDEDDQDFNFTYQYADNGSFRILVERRASA